MANIIIIKIYKTHDIFTGALFERAFIATSENLFSVKSLNLNLLVVSWKITQIVLTI